MRHHVRSLRLLVITCALAVTLPGLGVAPSAFSDEPAPSVSPSAPPSVSGQPKLPTSAYLILAEGAVDRYLVKRILQGLEKAEEAGARVAIIKLDTLGGRLDAALKIRDALLNMRLRIIAFVDKRAISAGALIALAAHDIVMAPGATIGAATPLRRTWKGAEAVGEKMISYFRKEMKATAESRNHPTQLAEAMVDTDVVIPGVVEKGKLLTLTTQEALRLKLAASQSGNLEHLLKAYQLELPVVKKSENAGAALRRGLGGWFGKYFRQFRGWHVWLICGLVLAIAEIFVSGFFLLWFGVGALLAALLAWLGMPRNFQAGAFLALSVLLLVFSRTIFKSILFRSRESMPTNIEALKGRSGVVLKPITGSLSPGRVKLGGEEWAAICEEKVRIAKGAKVEVLDVVGNKILVTLV